MAEFPALTLWTDAYLADTRHLSTTEHGAYLLLLITAWRSPGYCLPNDDRRLRLAAGSPREWTKIKPIVMAFWELGVDGNWRQKRLTLEANRAAQQRASAARAGKASALKRHGTGLTGVAFPLNGTPTPEQPPLPSSLFPHIPPNPPEDGGGSASPNGHDPKGDQTAPQPRPSRANGTNPRAQEITAMDAEEQARADARREKWAGRLAEYEKTGHWPSSWGPKPSTSKAIREAGVFLPAALHDDFRAIEARRNPK